MLVIGAAILWLADRWGTKTGEIDRPDVRRALGIGVAQALALFPGISRSGISISAGLFLGLDRESAARFSFLMAGPIIAGPGCFEARKLIRGEAGVRIRRRVLLVAGMVAAFVAGLAAIHFLLRYLRTNTLTVFVVYRIVLAAAVAIWLLLLR